jgi:hypothetical protein
MNGRYFSLLTIFIINLNDVESNSAWTASQNEMMTVTQKELDEAQKAAAFA